METNIRRSRNVPCSNIVKRSYGLILFKKINDRPNVLLIEKRLSYSFISFVIGSYDEKRESTIIRLFHGMTKAEKTVIMSLNFDYIWYHTFLLTTFSSYYEPGKFQPSYAKKRQKFERTFLADRGKKLNRLIDQSSNKPLLWEIPKGRRESGESELGCAIREIREEVGLRADQYRILWNIKPVIHRHTDANTTYVYKFYVAVTTKDVKTRMMNPHQLMEINDHKWCNKESAKQLLPQTLYQKILPLFKQIKRISC